MDDLVQWLGAQLDEDERIARAAAEQYGGAWAVDPAMESVRSDTGADVVEESHAPHVYIAAHDPARVLREIDAKRQILALHTELEDSEEMQTYCSTCDTTGRYPEYPCQTLRLLALPYADRPGYREDWQIS